MSSGSKCTMYTFFSWNVNGYSDCIHSTIKQIIKESSPSILFFTETKRTYNQLVTHFEQLTDYAYYISVHNPHQYHGVAMLVRKDIPHTLMSIDLGIERRKDSAKCASATVGRLIAVNIFDFVVIGTYTPNSGRTEETQKLVYRENVWDVAFYETIRSMSTTSEIVWMGDVNAAPVLEEDVSNKSMYSWAGCRPGERGNLNSLLKDGWVDVWRKEHPHNREYTWRGKQNSTKYGMRIDNIIITPGLWKNVNSSFICHSCDGSDHVPIGMHMTF